MSQLTQLLPMSLFQKENFEFGILSNRGEAVILHFVDWKRYLITDPMFWLKTYHSKMKQRYSQFIKSDNLFTLG